MKVKEIIDTDIVNYKKIAMFIAMPKCSFKCDREAKCCVCQNSQLAMEPSIEIPTEELIYRYFNNELSEAIVFGGLEPFDSASDLAYFLQKLIEISSSRLSFQINIPDIVIYTGYTENEVKRYYSWIYEYQFYFPLIIKYGRFIPNKEKKIDKELGITLASDNQYARRYGNVKSRKRNNYTNNTEINRE